MTNTVMFRQLNFFTGRLINGTICFLGCSHAMHNLFHGLVSIKQGLLGDVNLIVRSLYIDGRSLSSVLTLINEKKHQHMPVNYITFMMHICSVQINWAEQINTHWLKAPNKGTNEHAHTRCNDASSKPCETASLKGPGTLERSVALQASVYQPSTLHPLSCATTHLTGSPAASIGKRIRSYTVGQVN